MPTLDPDTCERWRDMVVDRNAATVGTITAFYLDRATGLPTWALVHTGWLTDALAERLLARQEQPYQASRQQDWCASLTARR